MMLYPAMKDLLKRVPSRYELVNVVAHRAIQEVADGKLDELLAEEEAE